MTKSKNGIYHNDISENPSGSIHPMRKFIELLLLEIYSSVPGQYPRQRLKPLEESAAVHLSKQQLKTRMSTRRDRTHARQYIARRFMGGLHPDVRVLLFDYLTHFDLPESIDLRYDAIPADVYQLAHNVIQRRVIETLSLIGEPLESIRENLTRVEGTLAPTIEQIECYLYFFWNLNPADDSAQGNSRAGWLRERLYTLQEQIKQTGTVRTPYYSPKPGTTPAADTEMSWEEFTQGPVILPLETYLYVQRVLAGEGDYHELIAGLGIPNTESDDVTDVMRQCFHILLYRFRWQIHRRWFDEADRTLKHLRVFAQVMRWFDISPVVHRKTLNTRYELQAKSPEDYGLVATGKDTPTE